MQRAHSLNIIKKCFSTHPVVAILGPRQCGKTTLAKMYAEPEITRSHPNYFDLEDPIDLARLQNPQLALANLQGLIVIDEIQRLPNLFTNLRVLVDHPIQQQQFLILGSASRDLINQSAETLAGRIAYVELTPFSYHETKDIEQLWLRGGFPRSFLAKTDADSFSWRQFYISTYLEQDLPNLGIQIPAQSLRRFWSMLTHYHGNIFNASELGRSFGAADTTIRRYLDILTGTFMVRQLQPWQENLKKRQVKSPKIYIRDSGILHGLLDIEDQQQLSLHPKLGTSWEGFALEEVISAHNAKSHQ